MLSITVELLHGVYRADPEGLAHTGRLELGEWPPAPLRVLAALVAADGTGANCRHTNGDELSFLENCPPPTIYASPPERVSHQKLLPRFVVEGAPALTTKREGFTIVSDVHAEHVGHKGTQVRPGVRVSPASPVITYLWNVEAPDEVVRGLEIRASRVGYLGCADSPVRLTVGTRTPEEPEGEAYCPDRDGDLVLGVPQAGVLAAMDAHFEEWQIHGPRVSRSQTPGLRRLARYGSPGRLPAEESERPAIIWIRLEAPQSGRRITPLVTAFKAATLRLYQEEIGEPPPVLHGHGIAGTGYELARYLALPDVGGQRSTGRLHGLALWLPPGTELAVVDGARRALRLLEVLRGDHVSARCRLSVGEERPWAANRRRWEAGARLWATATPAVYERRARSLSLADVSGWCSHAGLPAPVAFRSQRSPFIAGALDLAPTEVHTDSSDAKPYAHFELLFDHVVTGPVVIGGARQRGLGLCAPVAVSDG